MEEASKQGQDRVSSPTTSAPASSFIGQRPVEGNLKDQPVSPKDERTLSTNPSPEAAMTGPSKGHTGQLESSSTSRTPTAVYPLEQTYYYGGYENSPGNWDEYPYIGANGLQIGPPAMFNDNPSLLFHSGYGLDTQVAYGQFSPMANPLSPVMVDGQLFSPHQVPVTPPYYLPPVSPGLPPVSPGLPPVSPGLPHVASYLPVSQPELITAGNSGQEVHGDNVLLGPGSGYFLHFGSLGGVGLSGEPTSNQSNPSETASYFSPLTSPAAVYPQPFGILGPYDHNIGQFSQQRRSFHGLGSVRNSSTRTYQHGGPYQSSSYGAASISQWGNNKRGQLTPDKGGIKERNRETTYMSADAHGMSSDRNRGPRASKLKGKNTAEDSSSTPGIGKSGESISGTGYGPYNVADFPTDYKNAKFFIIKSFSEDNVHKSIKYSVWSSTPLGNRKLDAAYHEAKEMKDHCPVFLFFSVNASGQFCGVAKMVGPVDFENNAEYWQQDRWSGQFPVQWHVIKDVPNGQFRHILLENNDNKPVTHSRDSQEVKLDQGIEMLKIFKEYNSETSILDDFSFYDEREKALLERKARQGSSKTTSSILPDGYIGQLPDKFAEAIRLGDSSEVPKSK